MIKVMHHIICWFFAALIFHCSSEAQCTDNSYRGYFAIEAGDCDYICGDMIFRGPAFYKYDNNKVRFNKEVYLFDYFDVVKYRNACPVVSTDSLSLMLADSLSSFYIVNKALRSTNSLTLKESKGRTYVIYLIEFDAVSVGKQKIIHYLNGKKRFKKHSTFLVTKIREIEPISVLPVK